jgi:hypothetical protein
MSKYVLEENKPDAEHHPKNPALGPPPSSHSTRSNSPNSPNSPTFLASVHHAFQRRLLRRRDTQLPFGLDLHPTLGVGAVERSQRRLPHVRALIALGLVQVVGDGPQLRRRDIVGKLFALGRRPLARAIRPRVLERNHVVDVNIGYGLPGRVVVGRYPCPGCGGTGRVGDDVGAIALENVFAARAGRLGIHFIKSCGQGDMTAMLLPGVAGAALGTPEGKEVAFVAARVSECFYGEGGEFSLRRRSGGDSGLDACE